MEQLHGDLGGGLPPPRRPQLQPQLHPILLQGQQVPQDCQVGHVSHGTVAGTTGNNIISFSSITNNKHNGHWKVTIAPNSLLMVDLVVVASSTGVEHLEDDEVML